MKKIGALQRIKEYIDFKGLTNKDFEISVGFSNGAFSSQLKNNRTIGVDKLENILSVYPELNPNWLLTGTGSMITNKEYDLNESYRLLEEPIIELNPSAKSNCLVADVKVSAGFGSLMQDSQRLDDLKGISLLNAPYGLNVAFQIEGDSMYDTIHHLDYVAANHITDRNQIKDGYVYVVIEAENGAVCKRVYRDRNRWRLVSDNPVYPDYYCSNNQIISFFKAFQRISTDFRSYHKDLRLDVLQLQKEISLLTKRIDKAGL